MPWRTLDPAILLRFLRETSAATWVVDRDGYAVDTAEWLALTGQTERQAAGNGWMAAVHPDDLHRVQSAWATALSHATPYNSDYRIRCADGQYRWFNVRGAPVLDANGNPERWVGVILHIPGLARPSRSSGGNGANGDDAFEDIHPAALRAARAMLGWSAEQLAQEAGIARSTLRRLEEAGSATAHQKSVEKVLGVLERQQLRFSGQNGVVNGVSAILPGRD